MPYCRTRTQRIHSKLFTGEQTPGLFGKLAQDYLFFLANKNHHIDTFRMYCKKSTQLQVCTLVRRSGLQIRHFEKNSRAKKLKTQGKNSKLKEKTQ